jgi:hypothetical protein
LRRKTQFRLKTLLATKVKITAITLLAAKTTFKMSFFNIKLQAPAQCKYLYWLLAVIPFLAVGCAHIETVNLSAEEITKALSGNTIVHLNKRSGFKWFFGHDGKQVFDPDLGYPITGQWECFDGNSKVMLVGGRSKSARVRFDQIGR